MLTDIFQIVKRFFIHPTDYGFSHFYDIEYKHTAGATDRQGMLTPPRHMIPPPVFAQGFYFDHHKQTKSSTFYIFPIMTFTSIITCPIVTMSQAGAIGQQGMLTLPRRLIPPLSF